ncbi:hypothetical protein IVB16_27370 [Bradyrhizobium sp. 183]|uniref:hypothetical protein n=1 Tax=unclassified Bradyrhizobium TaxID=2631580 RepID=UPI001FFED9F5|nr:MULTISPECIES: hypothetical protein [unclassified Bradyrhizobium]UPJ78571.1 hypothetical protein IVB17_27370 [Bradyrhizobium sp. 184]UPJ86366.1 hypothetical protein IVB16_27370 [Bradyrhizobium sp. 183]
MIAAANLHIRDLTNETAGHVGAPALKASARAATARSRQAAAALSKIMVEAHTRAKADYAGELSCRGRAHHVDRPYSYYLALQMRSGFAEARVARTGMAPAFELPAQRWA